MSRRKAPTTTRRGAQARPAPDLVDRDFSASGPDALWVADITYVPTAAGLLSLSVVLEALSRRIVGWAMANHLRSELVLAALEMALAQRRPEGVALAERRVGPCPVDRRGGGGYEAAYAGTAGRLE